MASEKITICVTPAEKEEFSKLAKETGITQRQLVMLLLATRRQKDQYDIDWSSDEYVRMMLSPYREKIAILENQVHKLQDSLRQAETHTSSILKKRELLVRADISRFINYFDSAVSHNDPLPQGMYADYLASTPFDQHHIYADSEKLSSSIHREFIWEKADLRHCSLPETMSLGDIFF